MGSNQIIYEFCAENYTDLPAAITAGASRIELCDNLALGGTTPSAGVILQSCQYAHQYGASVNVMIRPRGGNFFYNDDELQIMLDDIVVAAQNGADGVVFGALTNNSTGDISFDKSKMSKLTDCAKSQGLVIAVHMCFDLVAYISPEILRSSLEYLHSLGVHIVLTHGGLSDTDVINNLDNLQSAVILTSNLPGLEILVGGGVNYANSTEIMRITGAKQVHGTKIVKF